MKKLLFVVMAMCIAITTVSAQGAKPEQKKVTQKENLTCYVMKDGKMYQSVADKETLLGKDVALKNGDKIMKNGLIKMKNGKEQTLKNDECIDENGTFHKSHTEYHKKKPTKLS